MDNLARDAMRMKALGYGCHYGKYKADHPGTIVEVEPAPPLPGDIQPKNCVQCGKEFIPSKRSDRIKFCSNECYKRANSERNKQKLREYARARSGRSFDVRICPQCGQEFQLGDRHGSCKFCSKECSLKAKRAQYIERRSRYADSKLG